MYRFQFVSTINDLVDAEEAEAVERTVRKPFRWAIFIIGVLMMVVGLLNLMFTHQWDALSTLLGGALLMYYSFGRSYIRRCHIRKKNAPSLELVLEFGYDFLEIEARGEGTFRREWSELLGLMDSAKGILLYFDDGVVNWLPNRVFSDKTERKAFVDFLRGHVKEDQ